MNLKSLLQSQKHGLPLPHPSMIPSLEPSPEFQRTRKRAIPIQGQLPKPSAVRQLDAILSAIIFSLNPDEHKEFISSLAIYNAISGKSTDPLSVIQSSTPPLSLASSPGSQTDTKRAAFKLPRLERISKSFSNLTPKGLVNKRILSSSETPKIGPSPRLPNVLDLDLVPLSQRSQGQGQPPLVSGISGVDKNVDLIAIRKRKRAPRVKHYGDAQPSMHCHICKLFLENMMPHDCGQEQLCLRLLQCLFFITFYLGCRSAKNVKVNACARVQKGTCRKVMYVSFEL